MKTSLVLCFILALYFFFPTANGQACESLLECDGCTSNPSCNWCAASASCQSGNPSNCTTQIFQASSCPFRKCAKYKSCVSCVEDPECGYCETLGLCLAGNTTGTSESYNCTSWVYDRCPHAPCIEYSSCESCLKDEFCGWCKSASMCMEGSLKEPLFGSCPAWFHSQGTPCTCCNFIVDPGEECDDGNSISGDGCSATCKLEFCGDAIINGGNEQCDDGNNNNFDGCSNVCSLNCGNGFVDLYEECDDGNTEDTDDCSNNCTQNICGNGRVDPGEVCDFGIKDNITACTTGCANYTTCINSTNCDVTFPPVSNTTTRPPTCGDGIVQSYEECDGNSGPGFTCTADCKKQTSSQRFGVQISDTGAVIVIELSTPVPLNSVLGGYYQQRKSLPCSYGVDQATLNKLGRAPYCTIPDLQYFLILLGANNTLFANSNSDSVTLNGTTFNYTSDLTTTLLKPQVPFKPQIRVSYIKDDNCGNSTATLYLDATGSYGSGGRPWVGGWRWSFNTDDTNPAAQTSLSQQIASQNNQPKMMVTYNWNRNNYYAFTLKLENYVGGADEQTFLYIDYTQSAQIYGPVNVTTKVNRIALFYSSEIACDGLSNNDYSFAWSRALGPLVQLDPTSASTSVLWTFPGTFQANNNYELEVDATLSGFTENPYITPDYVEVVVGSENIEAILLPGSRTISTGQRIILNATSSVDPDRRTSQPTYGWTCYTSNNISLPCPINDFLQQQTTGVVEVPAYNLPIGVHTIRVTVSKDNRQDYDENDLQIIYTDAPIANIDNVLQAGAPSKTLNVGKELVLKGSATPVDGARIISYQWTCTGLNTSDPTRFIGAQDRYLKVLANALEPGYYYTFTLTVADSVSNSSGSASKTLFADFPPAYGNCSIRWVDEQFYEVTCTGWEVILSEGIPLYYEYYYIGLSNETVLLLDLSFMNAVNITLPDLIQTVLVVVSDGHRNSRNVFLSIPPAKMKRQSTQTQSAIGIYQSSVQAAILANNIQALGVYSSALFNALNSAGPQNQNDLQLRTQLRTNMSVVLRDYFVVPPTVAYMQFKSALYNQLVSEAYLNEVSADVVTNTLPDLARFLQSGAAVGEYADHNTNQNYVNILGRLLLIANKYGLLADMDGRTLSDNVLSIIGTVTAFEYANLIPPQVGLLTDPQLTIRVQSEYPESMDTTKSISIGNQTATVVLPNTIPSRIARLTDTVTSIFIAIGVNPFQYAITGALINSDVLFFDFAEFDINQVVLANESVSYLIPKPNSPKTDLGICQVWDGNQGKWVDSCNSTNPYGDRSINCSCSDFSRLYHAARTWTPPPLVNVPAGNLSTPLVAPLVIAEEDHDIHPEIILLILAIVFGILMSVFMVFMIWKSRRAPRFEKVTGRGLKVPEDLDISPADTTKWVMPESLAEESLSVSSSEEEPSMRLNVPTKRNGIIEFKPPEVAEQESVQESEQEGEDSGSGSGEESGSGVESGEESGKDDGGSSGRVNFKGSGSAKGSSSGKGSGSEERRGSGSE